MKRFVLAMILAVLTISTASADGPATKAQIEKRLVGKTVQYGNDSRATYSRDGSYAFTQLSDGRVWRGTYTITNGQLCARLKSGEGRCDRISIDGGVMYLINRSGQRYPIN